MRAGRAVARSILANGIILICGIATGVIAARLLGPENRGVLAVIVFWPQLIASLSTLSFNEAATFGIGRHPHDADRVAAGAVRMALLLAGPTVVLCWILIPLVMGDGRASWWPAARLYALMFVPANFLSLAFLAWDQGRLRFNAYNGLRIVAPAVYLAVVVLLGLAGRISVASVVAASLIAVYTLTFIQVGRARTLAKVPVQSGVLRDLARRGVSFHWAAGLMILSAQADRVVALRLFDDATVGYYVVALALSTLGLSAVTLAIHTVLLPTLSRAAPGAREALMARGLRGATLLLAVTTATIAVPAPAWVALFFGDAYYPAGNLTRALSVAFFLVALRSVTVLGLRGLGDGRGGAIAETISLAIFALVCVPLAWRWGPYGLAVAVGVAALPALAYLAAHVRRRHGLSATALWGLRPATVRDCAHAARSVWTR